MCALGSCLVHAVCDAQLSCAPSARVGARNVASLSQSVYGHGGSRRPRRPVGCARTTVGHAWCPHNLHDLHPRPHSSHLQVLTPSPRGHTGPSPTAALLMSNLRALLRSSDEAFLELVDPISPSHPTTPGRPPSPPGTPTSDDGRPTNVAQVLRYLMLRGPNGSSLPYSLWGLPDRSQLLGYLPWSVRLGRTQKTRWLLVVISLYLIIFLDRPPPGGMRPSAGTPSFPQLSKHYGYRSNHCPHLWWMCTNHIHHLRVTGNRYTQLHYS